MEELIIDVENIDGENLKIELPFFKPYIVNNEDFLNMVRYLKKKFDLNIPSEANKALKHWSDLEESMVQESKEFVPYESVHFKHHFKLEGLKPFDIEEFYKSHYKTTRGW